MVPGVDDSESEIDSVVFFDSQPQSSTSRKSQWVFIDGYNYFESPDKSATSKVIFPR